MLQQALPPDPGPDRAAAARPVNPAEEELKAFVSVVLADTEDVWRDLFRRDLDRTYQNPKLVLFSGAVESACGFAETAVGPFDLAADQHVYIDLSFCEELKSRFQAPGDFAVAYVLAHEVGHHVQQLLGTMKRMSSLRVQLNKFGQNQMSVRLELQADYLAGVWRIMRSGRKPFWSPAMSRRQSGRRARWATTACRSRARAAWSRTPLRTAPPNSVPAGSDWGSRPAICSGWTISLTCPTTSSDGVGRQRGRRTAAPDRPGTP